MVSAFRYPRDRATQTVSLLPPCGVSRPLYTTRVSRLSLSLWVCKRLWHASVNTVHTTLRTPHLLAPAGTDEAAGETVRLRGAVAVACAVPQLLPLRAGMRE